MPTLSLNHDIVITDSEQAVKFIEALEKAEAMNKMERLTFEGNFCDIAKCEDTLGGSFCEYGYCDQRRVWERLKEYEDIGTVEKFAELVQAESEGRIIPKEAHQPSFVKYDAIDIFDQWNDKTGVLDKGTSWYYEIQGVIEEVAAMAFGAGVIYQSEAAAALAAKEGGNDD